MHSSNRDVPLNWRVRLALIRTFRCDFPEGRCLTLPVAVIRNRFLVPLCVFIFVRVILFDFCLFTVKLSANYRTDRPEIKGELTNLYQIYENCPFIRDFHCLGRFRLLQSAVPNRHPLRFDPVWAIASRFHRQISPKCLHYAIY